MTTWHELHTGVVHPWLCDQFGHLNVRNYSNLFNEAQFFAYARAGFPQSVALKHGGHWGAAICRTNFLKELRDVGDYLNELLNKKEDSAIFIEAKKIAKQVNKKTSVIYAGTDLCELVGSRWKTQINENAKSKAFVGSIPEVHHNEILSWDADLEGSKSNYVLILLRDNSENSQIAKRLDLTQKLLGEKVEIINIEAKSQSTTLFKLMELVLLGDLFSLSLADELNMIPEDIEGIENLKKLLED